MKELFENLNHVYVNLTPGNMLLVNFILAFVMFGVALGVKMDTFKDVFRNPKSLIIGIILQWVGLPLVTMILVILLSNVITPEIAFGMILVAACPGGNISNFISSLSKGNVELSVSMTAVSTAFSPLITPFNFWLWGNIYRNYAESKFENMPILEIEFMDVLVQILLILGLPILLGFLVSHYMPRIADKLKKPTSILSIILFIAMVAVSLNQVLTGLDKAGMLATAGVGILAVLAIVVVHNGSVLGSGYLTASLLKRPIADRRSLTIETGIQNSGLGLVMLLNPKIFDPATWGARDQMGNIILNSEGAPAGICGGLILVAALWGIWHILSGLTIATIFRRQKLS